MLQLALKLTFLLRSSYRSSNRFESFCSTRCIQRLIVSLIIVPYSSFDRTHNVRTFCWKVHEAVCGLWNRWLGCLWIWLFLVLIIILLIGFSYLFSLYLTERFQAAKVCRQTIWPGRGIADLHIAVSSPWPFEESVNRLPATISIDYCSRTDFWESGSLIVFGEYHPRWILSSESNSAGVVTPSAANLQQLS